MGHWRKRNGKLEHSVSTFKEGATAVNSVKPSDLKPGDSVTMGGKKHVYLGSTNHDGNSETHHFQHGSSGDYKSYPTNSVPAMQSRDAMETGDNSGAGS